jgi:hypothetical protein
MKRVASAFSFLREKKKVHSQAKTKKGPKATKLKIKFLRNEFEFVQDLELQARSQQIRFGLRREFYHKFYHTVNKKNQDGRISETTCG